MPPRARGLIIIHNEDFCCLNRRNSGIVPVGDEERIGAIGMIKKVFNRLTLCSLVALAIGIGMSAIMVASLTIAGDEVEETPAVAASSYIINFPQDKKMLDAISRDMLADKDVILALPDIEPAAGDVEDRPIKQ